MKISIKNLKPRLKVVTLHVHNEEELEIYQRSLEYGTLNENYEFNGIDI